MCTLTAELLERNHGVVELLVIVHDDLLIIAFANNKTGVTPTEVVHAPESVDREEETVDRVREDVYHHPTDEHKFSLEDEDDGLRSGQYQPNLKTKEDVRLPEDRIPLLSWR